MRWLSPLVVKLVSGNALLIAIILVTCAWLILDEVDRLARNDLTEHLRTQAGRLRDAINSAPDDPEEWTRIAHDFADRDPVHMRVVLLQPEGHVLVDSQANTPNEETFAERNEIQEALTSDDGWGLSIRGSGESATFYNHVALRAGSREHPRAVIRLSLPRQNITQRIWSERRVIGNLLLLVVLGVIVFAAVVMMIWSTPIRRITLVARSLSRGDLSARAPAYGSDELAGLGQSLNQMRDNHVSQLEAIDRHRRTLASLLAQLQEGVIVADAEHRIVLINPAAIRLLGLVTGTEATCLGQPLNECIPHATITGMLTQKESAVAGEHDEAPIQINGGSRSLWVLARAGDILLPNVTPDPGESRSLEERQVQGRLLVLTDVTEFQQMMQMKTDFAANASHELRTPLSAIRGAVETLKEMEWREENSSAQKFINMIDRHSARLEDIMGDLLDLSRIESSPTRFKPSAISLHDVLSDLHQRHQEKLRQKKITWQVNRPPDLDGVMLNEYLIRLILDNLVDNAWKFTPEQGAITIQCRRHPNRETDGSILEISVSDTGCGIPKADQNRVFERFFQVARDRAGKVPGTGLGLSIVRHAVLAMKGTVSLISEPGQGTTIAIRIPQPE